MRYDCGEGVAARMTDWSDEESYESLPEHRMGRTGILILQAERESQRELPASNLRHAFSECGVALTAYDGGVARLSMPAEG